MMNSKGISLVEVIVAIFIIGAIGLVVANIPNTISLITGTQAESRAHEVAARTIENIRLAGYDNLANGTTTISDPKLSGPGNMSGSSTITDCSAQICTHGELIKEITVTISWTESREPKNIVVKTLVSKGGLR